MKKTLLWLLALAFIFPVIGQVSAAQEEAFLTGDGYFLYQAESVYSGTICEEFSADLQPGETLTFTLDENSDFTGGEYVLWVRSNGNRERYDVLINGEPAASITRTGTDFGKAGMTLDRTEAPITLKAGDLLSLSVPEGEIYGWVDYIVLIAPDKELPPDPTNPNAGAGFRYEGEAYYDKTPDVTAEAADLQPGDTLTIPLKDNGEFVAGTYTLSVFSCGNREQFQVLVNGKAVGEITRGGTNFGMDQMTLDVLALPLTLTPEDTVSLVAQSGSYWGWVDFVSLQGEVKPEGDPVTVTDGALQFEAEFFYSRLNGRKYADLQPGTVIDLPLNTYEGFEEGWYNLTVRSCGTRECLYVRVNGKVLGSVSRLASGYGEEALSEDRFPTKIQLKPGDVLTLSAPADETYGWVDWVRLEKVQAPAEPLKPTETPETTPSVPQAQPTEPKANPGNALWIGIGAAVVVLAGIGAAVMIRKKKK